MNTDDLMKAALEIGVHHLARKRAGEVKTKNLDILTLPIWPEPTRGVPNTMVRSALFAAIQGKSRKMFKKMTKIASLNGMEISIKGEQFDQVDLDVFEHCMHLMRFKSLNDKVDFTAYEFLRGINRATGNSQYAWLKTVLDRLNDTTVEITIGDLEYRGHLISFFTRNKVTHEYSIRGTEELRDLYEEGWTQISIEDRRALMKKPLAQWLHGWYSSHADPYPITAEKIHELCGSDCKSLRFFKKGLGRALDEIKNLGVIKEWRLEGGMIYVNRIPSRSQTKHLMKRGLLK